MSLEDLDAFVWSELSPRRFVAGRALVNRLTRRAIQKWPDAVMLDWASGDGQQVVMGELAKSIERSERQNYQMGVILTLILGVLIQEIVKALLKWWLKSASNRVILVGWQAEMRT